MKMPDELLAAMWENIDWNHAEEILADLQKKLTVAAYAHDDKKIYDIQKRIVGNEEIKALAVRHIVASSAGPGIDGEKWVNASDKMKAALSLTSRDYHAQAMKQIHISSKFTGKVRIIGVPTYYDRAMQVLYDYSLAPVVEAWADKKSFAFRLGRSLMDASAYIFEALKGLDAPEIIVVADVHAFYAQIQHSWLLSHAPMDRAVLREFLKCGHVFAGELFPAEEIGISLGANLSPRLGNFVLDGLQRFVYDRLNPDWDGHSKIDYANGNMVRSADDILFTVRSQKDGEKLLAALSEFLAERGLTLSEEKTRIKNIHDGVTFLSRTYIKKQGRIHVYPSAAAVARIIAEMRDMILTHKKSQKNLIISVNTRLKRWADYHRFFDAYDAFRKVDSAVQAFLLEAAIARHSKMARAKVVQKYWYKKAAGEYVYALPNQKEIYVMRLTDIMLVSHRKVNLSKNPYLDEDYFESRTHTREIHNITGKYRSVWERQKGICAYCARPILEDQPRTVVQPDLTVPASPLNLIYVHEICRPNLLTVHYISGDVDNLNTIDVLNILHEIQEMSLRPKVYRAKGEIGKNWKHYNLKLFFAEQSTAALSLTFDQIEQIDRRPLPVSARRFSSFWVARDNCNTIAEAWLTEGYKLKDLNMDKEIVKFKRIVEDHSHIKIPKWLSESKIPDNARFEIENYFDYIKKKYGL